MQTYASAAQTLPSSPSPKDSATAQFSHWTVDTSLSFSPPSPEASPSFRRDLRQRSRRPPRSHRPPSNPRVIGNLVTVDERPVSAAIEFCPLASHPLLPTDEDLNAKRDQLAEVNVPDRHLSQGGFGVSSSVKPTIGGGEATHFAGYASRTSAFRVAIEWGFSEACCDRSKVPIQSGRSLWGQLRIWAEELPPVRSCVSVSTHGRDRDPRGDPRRR